MSEPDSFGPYRVRDNDTRVEHSVRFVYPDLQTILDKPASSHDGSALPQKNPFPIPAALALRAEEATES